MSILRGADKTMTDDQLCDLMSVEEIMRFSLIDWPAQRDRRADRLMGLAGPLLRRLLPRTESNHD